MQCATSIRPVLTQPQPQPPVMQPPYSMPQAFQTQAFQTLPHQFPTTTALHPGQQSSLADLPGAVAVSMPPRQQQPPVEPIQECNQTTCPKAALCLCCLS